MRHGTEKPPATEKAEAKKYLLWQHLLEHSYVLHCFPPDSMPCPEQKHGEAGCDKSVIMGSAVHIHGEVRATHCHSLPLIVTSPMAVPMRGEVRALRACLI